MQCSSCAQNNYTNICVFVCLCKSPATLARTQTLIISFFFQAFPLLCGKKCGKRHGSGPCTWAPPLFSFELLPSASAVSIQILSGVPVYLYIITAFLLSSYFSTLALWHKQCFCVPVTLHSQNAIKHFCSVALLLKLPQRNLISPLSHLNIWEILSPSMYWNVRPMMVNLNPTLLHTSPNKTK